MPNRRVWLLLLLAVVFRLITQGWDSGLLTPHPDERQVAFVSERVTAWSDDPEFFAYGSLHFRAVRAVTAVLGMARSYDGLLIGGRALSLAASMLALLMGWWMARRAWGDRTAELFLLLGAFVPLDIQLSHYATVEAHHAAWVVAGLAGCFWLATRSGWLPAALAGVAVGASLAVKVASLAMLAPLTLALIIASRRPRGPGLFELSAVAGTASIIAFWIGQPWAFAAARPPLVMVAIGLVALVLARVARDRTSRLRVALLTASLLALVVVVALVVATASGFSDGSGVASVAERLTPPLHQHYVRGVGEQVAMVMGDADLPYVRVYHGTLPILYPLRELARWGVGPMLLIAVFGGAVCGCWWSLRRVGRWLGRISAPGSVLLVLLLVWVLPMSFRLSTLHVKYLRYFGPLVVPFAMLAAWWLLRLPSRWRRPAVALTVAGTVVWGVMYVWTFVDPHPHRAASVWLADMVKADQVVAFEHWDETVRLKDGTRVDLPSYDLPDDEAKVGRWLEVLEEADWVVLTSNRVRRTVLVNRERFPRTGRLYRLLLSGEAGFQPVARIDRSPRLLGLERPVQLSDESFLNYDFPRVVVLRRVGDVDAAGLARRVERPLPFLEHLGPADLERRTVEPLQRLPSVPGWAAQMVQVGSWLVVFLGFGLAAWAVLLPLVRSWPDAGVGLSIVTGWIVPAWLMWVGSELGLWPISPATATWMFLVVAAVGLLTLHRRRSLALRLWCDRRSGILLVVAITVAVWVLFAVIRAWNPAIFWGEKPMDFSFLNAFLRAPAWPPDEPWMAGMPLHYYYFGQVLSAMPILATGGHSAVGYNLMSATIPGLSAALLAALGLALVRRGRRLAAWLLPLLVLLTGNLSWLMQLDLARQGRWFDMWWATSRVIPGFAIDEYPLWTALFADLHGHFIALPVMLAALLWGWHVVHLSDRRWLGAAVLCGVSTAVLVATNPWDVFILTATLAVGTLAAARRPLRGLLRLAAAGVFSVAAALPFVFELLAGIGAGAGGRGLFLTDADFAPAWAVLVHFGPFLAPLLVLALALLFTGRSWMLVLPLALAGGALGVAMSSTAAALGLASAVLLASMALRAPSRTSRLLWSLAALGMVAVSACERFTLIDRMNTIFKVYNGVWVLLAVAIGGLLVIESGRRRALLAVIWIPLQLVALVNLPLGVAQGWLQPRIESPRPTLDGQAFLADADPQTWFLVRGLQGMARPGDVVAEAADLAYAEFTRIAMHTGQPTVVGWPWHLQQRGQDRREIDARYRDLTELYGGTDPYLRRELLDRYRIRWIVMSDLERRTYQIAADEPFASVPGVVRVAEHDGAALYMVLDDGAAPLPMATAPGRELPPAVRPLAKLPKVASAAARAVAVDDRGGTVVLPDGSLFELDPVGRPKPSTATLPCPAVSVARRAGTTWASCADGSFWLQDGRVWRPMAAVDGALNLTAGRDLWAWGSSGLWRLRGSSWQQVSRGLVVAAAALGDAVAATNGREVWTLRGAVQRAVGVPLEQVRALAWEGTSLWALAGDGLYRSGGSVLPWRQSLPGIGGVSAMAGSVDRIWLVLDDGTLVQQARARCSSPFTGGETGELNEPRGIAVSDAGWFAVADTGHDRVVWFTLAGTCLESAGEEGSVPGAFSEPTGISLGPDDTLAVTDTWNGRIQLLRPDGVVQVVGSDLYGPRDVLWIPDGSLLVADTGNRLLLRYRPPKWEKEEIIRLPGPVVGLEWVNGLAAVAVPFAGEVALVDIASKSEVRRLPVPGWEQGQQQEGYLALLPSGELLASAPHTGELWRLDPGGGEPVRAAGDVPGVTAFEILPGGQILAAVTPQHHLVKISLD